MNIGEKIRHIRTSKKLSTDKVAKLAGIGQSTISEIELGKKSPTVATLEKICSALDITLVQLFSDISESEPIHISPDVKDLLDNVRNLTPEQLQKLTEFLKTF